MPPPPQAGSIPPASESPFGAYEGPPPAPSRAEVRAPAPGSRTGLYAAAAAVVVLALAGGGAYMSGVLDGALGQGTGTEVSPPTLDPAAGAADTPPEDVASGEIDDPAPQPQPQPDEPPASPGTQGGNQDVAVIPRPDLPEPPTELPEPPVAEPPAATPVAWVNHFGGGSCFYAAASDATGPATYIEGFGTSAEPFDAMVAQFRTIYDAEPALDLQLIEPKQCAVADFLQAIRGSPADRPELTLSSDLIESGQALRGTLGNLEGRETDVLLIDNAGVVYNLAAHLKQEPERASFNIKLGLQTDEPVPQIIIALTSPDGLETAKVEAPVLAETLFPKILDEIDDGNIDAAATARYFRLGG